MGRPARFSEEQILDAALETVGERGPAAATMAAIAAGLGAPVGSIYHRFASRELLLAHLWLREVSRFQSGFVHALRAHDPVGAALHTPRWCRAHPQRARMLLLYRREDLAQRWPEELGQQLADLNAAVTRAVADFAATGHDTQRVIFALIDVPYGAVRRYLAQGQVPPVSVEELIAETCRALLGPR